MSISGAAAAAKLAAQAMEHLRIWLAAVPVERDEEVTSYLRQRRLFDAAELWVNERNRNRHRNV